ncbi:hypothetical protein M426DRAFT_315930 [Hypoxylon sp. CI-4A]|nr:hypothetical protein M426DRAFT_315930 [Hypoxylon sp. CI-4A]
MTDMMNPQTPPRKLFKPSSKTKTPTPLKRQGQATPTPSTTRSHDALTPTETVSRSTDTRGDHANSPVRSIAGKLREVVNPSPHNLPEPSNPTDALNSPTDIAKYFADQGNSEMSNFVSALAGKTQDPTGATDNDSNSNSNKNSSAANGDATGVTSEASIPIKELPRDDALVTSPNERTKEALDKSTTSASVMSQDVKDLGGSEGEEDVTERRNLGLDASFAERSPSIDTPQDVSKKAEGTAKATKGQVSGVKPTNIAGEPNTTDISKGAQPGMPRTEGSQDSNSADKSSERSDPTDSSKDTEGTTSNASKTTPNTAASYFDSTATSNASKDALPNGNSKQGSAGVLEDGTRVADNMGSPAHIERRIEIPLPRPEKVVSSPPVPTRPDISSIAAGLGDTNDLPDTQDLPSTDDLPNAPEDPPEEILDPSVHSPSSNITPIPKISKITPIGMAPPPDLLNLARGLGGNVIDDVGNIVDESGKVLGHATGDLPAMVGRKVADNGEVYGEEGEIIGYVSENFTGSPPPPPTDIPGNVLGGLKVDHQGNILDSNGNIIGRFNEKASENGDLAPFMRHSQKGEPRTEDNDQKPDEEKKPKVNAHTGGSPSDIFLDVKSTTDGIQLTIRIPTTFGRQPQDS